MRNRPYPVLKCSRRERMARFTPRTTERERCVCLPSVKSPRRSALRIFVCRIFARPAISSTRCLSHASRAHSWAFPRRLSAWSSRREAALPSCDAESELRERAPDVTRTDKLHQHRGSISLEVEVSRHHADWQIWGLLDCTRHSQAGRLATASRDERKKTDSPREGWEDGTPPPHRDFRGEVWC